MSRERSWLVAAVAAAAILRLSGLGWDGWHHQHPDERFLVMVADRLELTGSPAVALDPARTPANPNNRGFDFYTYGALPPLANRVVAGFLGVADYAGLLVVGRVLAVMLDLVALLLAAALARRLGGPAAGVTTAALWAACPLLLQQARFGTTDTWGLAALLGVAWLVVAVPLTTGRLALAGAAVGVAAACKPNLVVVALVPVTAAAMAWWRQGGGVRPAGRLGAGLAASGTCAVVAAKVLDPGLFAGVFSLAPNPRRLNAVRQLAGYLSGEGQFPPALQWVDRVPVLEPLYQLLAAGTGPLLGAAVVLGLVAVARCMVRGDGRWLPIVVWALPVVLWHLTHFTCSMRHLLPLLAFAVVAAGVWLAARESWVRWTWVGGAMVWGVAWAAVAWQPYTRVEASRWLAEHMPPGAVITAEYWDDALPLPGAGGESLRVLTMRVFDEDTAAKREHLLEVLNAADAVVLASQRGVGSITRVPDVYPVTGEYYHLLFSGALGFEPAAHFRRSPGFGPFRMSTLAAEEVLSVYDHPPVWVFQKSEQYDPHVARRLLERVELPEPGWNTRELAARGTPPYQELRPGRGPGLPGREGRGPVGALAAVAAWWMVLELLGLGARAGLGRWLRRLPDGGWGVARALGLMAAGVSWLWLGWLGVPGWNGWLPVVVLLVALPWGVRAWRRAWREPGFRAVAVVVWAGFALFLVLRLLNPEVYWGEKPMEAAILTSLWRAPTLPPMEPWFAGSPLHYYFFGYLPFGLLGRALDLELGVVFTLATATVPALAMGCAVGAGWLLSGRVAGGVLAAVLAQLTGTAASVLRPSLLADPSFDRFWAVSRVIPDTINEFPVWTALFADLHPHFMAFPGLLAAVVAGSAVAVGRWPLRTGLYLMAGVMACQGMANTWEVPVLLGLAGAAVLAVMGKRLFSSRGMAMAAEGVAGAGLLIVVVTLPFWRSVRLTPGGMSLAEGARPEVLHYLELFGVPLALGAIAFLGTVLAPWGALLAGQATTPPSSARRQFWAWVVVGAGVVAVMVPEVVTVADRMNTVFKFHLQAHMLLAVGLAGVLAGVLPRLSRPVRWSGWVVAGAVVAVGLATTLACAAAVVGTRRVPGPRPALDGAAYLAHWRPGTAAAVAALTRLPHGMVVAEPLGPPYSDSLRIPMFTGNPAVVGWEYHLWQRRQAWGAIVMRQRDLRVLLEGQDQEVVNALARRYGVTAACSWDGRAPAVARGPGWHPYLLHDSGTVWLGSEGGGGE